MAPRKGSIFNKQNAVKVEAVLRDHLRNMRDKVKGNDFAVADVTLTYGELVRRTNVGIPRGQKPYLDAVAAFCKRSGEPSLDCLVVSRKTAKPGVGFRQEGSGWEQQVRSLFEPR